MAHSVYKAHAFLHAGSTIGTSARAAIPIQNTGLAFGIGSAMTLVGTGCLLTERLHPGAGPGVLVVPLAGALAYGLARLWSAAGSSAALRYGLPGALGIAALSFCLHAVSTRFNPVTPVLTPGWLTSTFVTAVFLGLFLFQVLLWRFRELPFGRAFYVHALNGFYVGTHANRLLSRVWPKAEAR